MRPTLLSVTAALVVLAACAPATDEAGTGTAVPATPSPTVAVPSSTPAAPVDPPTASATLEPQDLWVFPGPEVVVGDELDVEVPTFGTAAPDVTSLSVSWDGEVIDVDAAELVDPIVGGRVAFDLPVELEPGEHLLEVAATVDGEPLERSRTVQVQPAEQRPDDLAWFSVASDCCRLHAVTGTPVGDRLEEVAAELDRAATTVARRFGVGPDVDAEPVDIVVLANPWGNGGFANDRRVVLALPARDPAPGDLATLAVHELTHVLQGRVARAPTAFEEGVAVQTAGGHYAVTDLRAEAAALAAAGELVSLEVLYDDFAELQHEQRYLQAAAFVQWLVDVHGEDALQDALRHDAGDADPAAWLDEALQAVVATDLDEADAAFTGWLARAEPQAVADATIGELVRLQDLRRRWQSTYAPWEALYQEFRETGRSPADVTGDLDEVDPARAVRRPTSAAHVAVETVFAVAQQALVDGDHQLLATLVDDLGEVVDRARVADGLPGLHLAIVRAVDIPPSEVAAVTVDGTTATVTTTDGGTIDLEAAPGRWRQVSG